MLQASMRKDLLIGQVAARAGVNVRTLRYYEQVGVLPAPKRRHTGHASAGYRLYSEEDLERIRLIKGARLLDLSLAEIRELLAALDGEPVTGRLDLLVRKKLAVLDARIRELRLLRDRLERVAEVLARDSVERPGHCCDPLCGPQTCPPPRIQIERRGTGRGRENTNRR
jgi:DNA-binding transcriptional MerR regulator